MKIGGLLMGCEMGVESVVPAISPVYCCPEALIDNSWSFNSDLWSVGAILFHMYTGNFPISWLIISLEILIIKRFSPVWFWTIVPTRPTAVCGWLCGGDGWCDDGWGCEETRRRERYHYQYWYCRYPVLSVGNSNSCDFTIFACYCDFTLCYPAGFCLPGSGVDGAPLSPELHDLLTGLLEPDPKLRSVLLIATLWDRNKMSKHYFSDKVIPLFQRFSLVLHF